MQSKQSKLELSMVLQGFLHMRDGISPPVSHCSTSFKAALQGMCWSAGNSRVLNIMLDAAAAAIWVLLCDSNQASGIVSSSMKIISKRYMWMLMTLQCHVLWRPHVRHWVSTISSSELHCYLSGCGALYPLQAAMYDAYVFLLFGIRRRWVRASLLWILRFNGQEPPGLSSVMAHLDLQLIPQPQRHLSTRLLVEPLALRLARLREALEECNCRYFESEFLPDPLAGSGCALVHRQHASLVVYVICVHPGNFVHEGESCNGCAVMCCTI